jgi:hypothetical protein
MATLKISDLSVGDWVICNGFKATIAGYNVESGSIQVLTKQKNKMWFGLDDIEPIPITAEILEKNGWSTDGMYARLRITEYSHLEYYYHEHRLRKYYCGVDEWQNHAKVNDITFAVHCYSVHQLQRALSLANIDKEITL